MAEPLKKAGEVVKTTAEESGKGSEKTKMVRLRPDLVEMINWVCRVEKTKAATLLDPIIRGPIAARYGRHKELIDGIRRAAETAKVADAKRKK